MTKYFFLFVFFIGLSASIYIRKEICPPNEEFLICGSACPPNCSSLGDLVNCSEDCVEGCFCKPGYLRNDNGTCVIPDKCYEGVEFCRPDEEFQFCGTACPRTCKEPKPNMMCGLACSIGCICKAGLVRDTVNNKCVTLDNCPPEPSNETETCLNENEVFDICNAGCEPTCEDPVPICTGICKAGCICAPGFIRDEENLCVSTDNCESYIDTLLKYFNQTVN